MGAFAIGRAFVAAQRMGQVESARVDLHRIPIMVDRDGDGPSGAAPARSHAPLCVLLLRAYEMCDADIVREFFALMRFARRRTLAHGASNLRKHTAVSTSVASGGFFVSGFLFRTQAGAVFCVGRGRPYNTRKGKAVRRLCADLSLPTSLRCIRKPFCSQRSDTCESNTDRRRAGRPVMS